ncbi:MAG: dTMP kinase [Spirochaetales bacterium]|nr:MAG: dTMP kinase [Spirochaetales bacterium]
MVPLDNLIVLEGIDGAGTTTQARLLTQRLKQNSRTVWATSEPTGSPIGRLIREILRSDLEADPETIAHLFAADRSHHLRGSDGIIAHLSAGDIVVCDRYKYSSLAYQSVDMPMEVITALNARFPDPGLLFFVDLPVETGAQRLSRRSSLEIFEYDEFQHKVRSNYLRVLDKASTTTRLHVLDGTQTVEAIAEKIWNYVKDSSIFKE